MAVQRAGFVSPNNPILRQNATPLSPVETTTKETKKIIQQLLQRAYGEQIDRTKPMMVGLAAPQIGITKRIILVDTGADAHGGVSNLQVFINPEITWQSQEENEWYEGCYSTDRVCGIVSRPTSIKISAINQQGENIMQKYSGYIARIFQHEIDHLNGIFFVSHITNDNDLHWVEDYEFSQYRDNEAWRSWPKKCPRQRWEKIKAMV